MNHELATKLNSHLNTDTGLLDMPAVLDTLETYFAIDMLEAIYTGGTPAHDDALDIYQQAATWNRDVKADKKVKNIPGSWRGVKVFFVSLVALLAGAVSPLLMAAMVL